MTVRFEKIDDISSSRVTFYSAFLGDKDLSEFEIFDGKDFGNHLEEQQYLYQIIDRIRRCGAKSHYFRGEDSANALPGKSQDLTKLIEANTNNDFGLRLYCIRIHTGLVVLLNGGIKTTLKAQDCENVKSFFKTAVAVARQIDKAINNREIDIKEKNCLDYHTIDI